MPNGRIAAASTSYIYQVKTHVAAAVETRLGVLPGYSRCLFRFDLSSSVGILGAAASSNFRRKDTPLPQRVHELQIIHLR